MLDFSKMAILIFVKVSGIIEWHHWLASRWQTVWCHIFSSPKITWNISQVGSKNSTWYQVVPPKWKTLKTKSSYTEPTRIARVVFPLTAVLRHNNNNLEIFMSRQLLPPGTAGGAQHTVSQSSPLEGCGMQQVQANFLQVALNFLQLTQDHAPLLLDFSLVKGAALHDFWQQLNSWKTQMLFTTKRRNAHTRC